MSAAEALRAARMAGIDIRIEDGALALAAQAPPPTEILELLARHKPGVIALLRPGRDGWSAEDWRTFFDERAAVAEIDAGLPRPEAMARAFACCVGEWMNRNFRRSPSGRCLACGGADRTDDPLLPYGIEPIGRAWLHSRCWPAWHAWRKAEAVAALNAMGIGPPAGFSDEFQKPCRPLPFSDVLP